MSNTLIRPKFPPVRARASKSISAEAFHVPFVIVSRAVSRGTAVVTLPCSVNSFTSTVVQEIGCDIVTFGLTLVQQEVADPALSNSTSSITPLSLHNTTLD